VTVVSDNFNRANENLEASANWSMDDGGTGVLRIVSQAVEESTAAYIVKYRWVGTALSGADSYVQADINTGTDDWDTPMVGLRQTAGTGASNNDGYAAGPSNADTHYLLEITDGSESVLGSWGTPADNTTYAYYLEGDGNNLVVEIDGTERISTTDSTQSTASVGIFWGGWGSAPDGRIDNWEAGDLGVSIPIAAILVSQARRRRA